MRFIDDGEYRTPFADALATALGLPDDSEGMQLREFRFGTLTGLWRENVDVFDVVAVENSATGNGDFKRFLLWCRNHAKTTGRCLRFVEMMNERLSDHLCGKWGFTRVGDNCEWRTQE